MKRRGSSSSFSSVAKKLSAIALSNASPTEPYDTREFVAALRKRRITPQVAQNLNRPGGSAIDARTTRHAGHRLSQYFRKRIEECFGWGKQDRLLRRPKFRSRAKIGWLMELSMIGYNMLRMATLKRDLCVPNYYHEAAGREGAAMLEEMRGSAYARTSPTGTAEIAWNEKLLKRRCAKPSLQIRNCSRRSGSWPSSIPNTTQRAKLPNRNRPHAAWDSAHAWCYSGDAARPRVAFCGEHRGTSQYDD